VHVTKKHEGVKEKLHSFLSAAVEGGGWSASRPERFVPANKLSVPNEQETERGTEPVWTHGGGGGFFCRCWESNHCSVGQAVA